MTLTLQVLGSLALIAAVVWFVFKLPGGGEALLGWASPLALFSAWAGLLGLGLTVLLWVLPWPDYWLVAAFLGFYPAALASGVLVLWLYREETSPAEGVEAQLLQARVGIALALFAVALGYVFVFTHAPR